MLLRPKDIDTLQRTTLALHEERDLESLHAAAPALFMTAIPNDYCMWLESGPSGDGDGMCNIAFWDSPVRARPALLQRGLELSNDHPFTQHATCSGHWGPLRLSDFWTLKQLKASRIYRDVYRHLGIARLISSAIFRGHRLGAINLGRAETSRDFSERDVTMLGLIMPHFDMALRAAEQATARRKALAEACPELGLTTREAEVAVWLARGRTNPEIASILAMQPRTVEKHVERILVKLGVENRTGAAMLIAGLEAMPPRTAPPPELTAAIAKIGTRARRERR